MPEQCWKRQYGIIYKFRVMLYVLAGIHVVGVDAICILCHILWYFSLNKVSQISFSLEHYKRVFSNKLSLLCHAIEKKLQCNAALIKVFPKKHPKQFPMLT